MPQINTQSRKSDIFDHIAHRRSHDKKKVDLSAGMVRKAHGYRGRGQVVAFDESSHLPIVRPHMAESVKDTPQRLKESQKLSDAQQKDSDTVRKPETVRKSASMSGDAKSSNQVAKPEVTKDSKPERETKYEFGSTQANIPETSDAHKAIAAMQKRIPKEHLVPGRAEEEEADKPHVTVRYGIHGDDTSGVKKYLAGQKPFEAKLGKTNVFPQSKSSDGAAVVHAEVHSPDLHRMNSEIAKHGKFKESDFHDYKPHVTVAYVKPEHADKYKGMAGAEGKSFKVTHIAVSDKDGNHEEVALGGKQDAAGAKPEEKPKKAGTGFGALNLTKGQTVHLNSGIHGSIQHVNTSMKIVRIKTHDGHNLTVRHSQIAAVEDGKNDRNRSAESAATV